MVLHGIANAFSWNIRVVKINRIERLKETKFFNAAKICSLAAGAAGKPLRKKELDWSLDWSLCDFNPARAAEQVALL